MINPDKTLLCTLSAFALAVEGRPLLQDDLQLQGNEGRTLEDTQVASGINPASFLLLDEGDKDALGTEVPVPNVSEIEVKTEPVQPPNNDFQPRDSSAAEETDSSADSTASEEEPEKPKKKTWTTKNLIGAALTGALVAGIVLAGGHAATKPKYAGPISSTEKIHSGTMTPNWDRWNDVMAWKMGDWPKYVPRNKRVKLET